MSRSRVHWASTSMAVAATVMCSARASAYECVAAERDALSHLLLLSLTAAVRTWAGHGDSGHADAVLDVHCGQVDAVTAVGMLYQATHNGQQHASAPDVHAEGTSVCLAS